MTLARYFSLTGSHYAPLLKLGIPVIIGQMGLILVGFADNVMVSHHGLLDLAAASFVNNFLNLAIIFGLGFSYGLTPLVATYDEKKEPTRVTHFFVHSLLLNASIGLAIGAILWSLQGHLSLFNLPSELQERAVPYYRIQVIGFLVVMLFNSFKQFSEGMKHTRLPMYVTLAANLLNILLNYLLIFGKWGFPEWGLYGAGIATLVSRVGMLVAMVVLIGRMPCYAAMRRALRRVRFDASEGILPLVRLGAPVAVQMGLEAASFSIIAIFVARIGTTALAAHQITSTISTIFFMIYYGIGAAIAIRISTLQAQGKIADTRYVASAGMHLCTLFAMLMLPLLFTVLREPLVMLFKASDAVAAATFLTFIPLCLYQIGDALQIIYANSLRGLGAVRSLAPAAALCHLGIAPLVGYLFAFHLGLSDKSLQLMALWFAFPLSLTTLGLIWRYYFRRATNPLTSVAYL